MSDKELRDFIPFLRIEDNCVISKRGDITFGWQVYLPVAYSVNEEGYDSIIDSFMQAYKILPHWCVVHKQDIFKYDMYESSTIGEFLGDSYEKHFNGRKYLNSYCYIYLTFSSKQTIQSALNVSSLLNKFNVKIPNQAKIEKCYSYASQFESILSNNQLLSLKLLKTEDYLYRGEKGEDLGVIPAYLKLYSDNKSLDYPLHFYQDRVECGDKIAKCWYIQDSDSYSTNVNSVSFISSMSSNTSSVYLSGGSPIGYQLQIPHIVNRYVLTLPKKLVEDELDQKKRLMNSFSLYSASCRVNAEELDDYLDLCARDDVPTIKCFTNVIAWGDEREIKDISNLVVTGFSTLGIVCTEETKTFPTLFYAGIPTAGGELGYNYYLTSEMSAFLCHGLWDGYDTGMKGGALKFNDRRRMIPMNLDIQSRARELGYVDNLNTIIVGPSGSGKSFTVNTLAKYFYNDNQHILIIDVGDSYQGITQIINEETNGKDGIYISFDPAYPLSFNPFLGRKKWVIKKKENDINNEYDVFDNENMFIVSNNKKDDDNEADNAGLEFFLSLIKTMFEPKNGWNKQITRILTYCIELFFDYWDNGYTENDVIKLQEAFVNEQRERFEKIRKEFNEEEIKKQWENPLDMIFPVGRKGIEPLFDNFFKFISFYVAPILKDGTLRIDNIPVSKDIFEIDELAIAMGKYKIGGTYGELLNSKNPIDYFQSRFTVMEVDKIKDNEDIFPIAILCMLHSFEDKMRTLPCQKVMIIEEAWSAIAKPSMAKFIVWLWRTARKFRTSAIVVTQQLSDLLASDIIKGAIVQNSSIKILLDQSKNANNFEESARILAMTPKDVGLVLSLNRNLNPNYLYKEGFFSIGEHYSNVFGIEVSLEEALAYESDKVKKKPVFDIAKQTGSIIQAIKIKAKEIRGY